MIAQHHDPVVLRRARRSNRQRARELAQIERVLHGIELKGLAWQRAVGQTGDEWVAQDRGIDRFDRMPELVGERHQSLSMTNAVIARHRQEMPWRPTAPLPVGARVAKNDCLPARGWKNTQ